MKDITRKHLWPAALVAALAVVGVLAAFVVLTGPQRGTVEAQGICANASGAALQALMQAGICGESTATPEPSPTTGGPDPTTAPGTTPGATPGGPDPVAPGQTPGATPEPSGVCDVTGAALAALIQAGLCMEPTATPLPTATPTMAPPTATPEPTMAPTGMPTRLTVSADSNRTGVVELDWAAVAGAEGYTVSALDLAEAGGTVAAFEMVGADRLETQLTGLSSGKEYIFVLYADFGEGMEPRYSTAVAITQKVTWLGGS